MARLSVHDYFLNMARLVSLRGTCLRRKVGCVLVDKQHRVLATGYNGVARGQPHCGEEGCACDGMRYRSGEGLDNCLAIHAEQNALLQCREPDNVHVAYVTVTPCVTCAKLLLNTGVRDVIAWEPYAHDADTRKIFEEAGVTLVIYEQHLRQKAQCEIKTLGLV